MIDQDLVEFDRHHDHPHSKFNPGVIDAEARLFDKVVVIIKFWVGVVDTLPLK